MRRTCCLTVAPPALPLQVRLCLVINKVDRLILELRLSAGEAYERLKAIIAHVNMIVSSFHSEKYMSGAVCVVCGVCGVCVGGVGWAGMWGCGQVCCGGWRREVWAVYVCAWGRATSWWWRRGACQGNR